MVTHCSTGTCIAISRGMLHRPKSSRSSSISNLKCINIIHLKNQDHPTSSESQFNHLFQILQLFLLESNSERQIFQIAFLKLYRTHLLVLVKDVRVVAKHLGGRRQLEIVKVLAEDARRLVAHERLVAELHAQAE
jgi:hypothetical protein